jgi:hypothetical protein
VISANVGGPPRAIRAESKPAEHRSARIKRQIDLEHNSQRTIERGLATSTRAAEAGAPEPARVRATQLLALLRSVPELQETVLAIEAGGGFEAMGSPWECRTAGAKRRQILQVRVDKTGEHDDKLPPMTSASAPISAPAPATEGYARQSFKRRKSRRWRR